MVKGKVFLNVLLAIALVASSAAVAHAGAGSGSSVNAILFDCYAIEDGANSPYVLELTDQFGIRKHVNVGKAKLLCTQTTAVKVERGPVLNPDFDALGGGDAADHIKCYKASSRRDKGPDAVVTITDPLATETVELEKLRFLCAPAFKEILQQNQNHHRERRDRD